MSAPHVTAIIGAGVMGETLLSGLIRAGRPVDQLLVGEKRAEPVRSNREERPGGDPVGAVHRAVDPDA